MRHSIAKGQEFFSGVYKITSTSTSKVYVGSSISLRRRYYQHCSALRLKTHTNKRLQQDYDACGASDLLFEIIAFCSPHECIVKEQEAYDALSPEYNYSESAAKPKLNVETSAETKILQSNVAKIGYANGRINPAKGKPLNAKSRMALIAANTGRKKSAETIAKFRSTMAEKQVKHSLEAVKNSSEKQMCFYLVSKNGESTVLRSDRLEALIGRNRGAIRQAVCKKRSVNGFMVSTYYNPSSNSA